MKNLMTVGLGQRPEQILRVRTRDGKVYDLGRQVEGTDLYARWHQWRQRAKIAAYCRDRLRTLTGVERQEFLEEMEARCG